MRTTTLIFLTVSCTVIHQSQSGIILEKVGDTLDKIKCGVHSIGNSIFHRGQPSHPCDEKQNGRPQDGHANQGGHGFQIWLPFTNRGQGNKGQQNPNFNRENGNFGETNPLNGYNTGNGYGHGTQNQHNRDQLANNGQHGNTREPLPGNNGYGNTGYQFPHNQGSGNVGEPFFNSPGKASTGQPFPKNQGYEGSGSSTTPSTNNSNNVAGQSVANSPIDGTSLGNVSEQPGNESQPKPIGSNQNRNGNEHSSNNDSFNQNGGSQSQNCTVFDVRYDNNQTVSNNCTQGGRRFMTAVKGNCAAGQVADSSGVCRDQY